jgi:ATP-dependent Lon protease
MVLPLSVGREKSIRAIESAMGGTPRLIAVVAQKDVKVEDPGRDDFYGTGVLAEVTQYLKMPDGTLKVFLQGAERIKIERCELSAERGFWTARLSYPTVPAAKTTSEVQALMRHALELFGEHVRLSRRAPPELAGTLSALEDPSHLSDIVAANCLVKTADRQSLLEIIDPVERLRRLLELLKTDIEILNLDRKIHTRVRTQIERSQKEYYLTEQMKAIQKELKQKDDFAQEIEELRKNIAEAGMPKAALEAATKEVARLEKMMPYSPESTVSRTYLDWMIHMPWSKRTRDNLDLDRAQKILDEEHHGLEKVKDRVIEYLAVSKLTKSLKGPILCFVGPPGVGKTTLARSIAKTLGRKFARISLGGVRDEAEIRGHRRTYIGSLPGRLVQSLRKAQSRNPLFLFDEIDKMGTDWRGDPAAALLEVLDPAQNPSFLDHYLDVEFDLSQVLFICTANTLDGIPHSLQDRLEILRFSGYTQAEKLAIAKAHLWPKELKEHGLKGGQIRIDDAAIAAAIDQYTREAGVRQLERELATVIRKAAKDVVLGKTDPIAVTTENLSRFLGAPKFPRETPSYNSIGVSTGLAWTETGGVTMAIEVTAMPGKGDLKLTGKLGSVMTESAQAAFSYIKSMARVFGVAPEAFKDVDYHIHVPEGATPKDGPSAGIAIATALLSYMTGRPVLPGVAMTGEMTLRGRVLPIGGLKEKLLAALRDGMNLVLYPELNKKDLDEAPAEVLSGLKLVPVKRFDEVAELALGLASSPAPGLSMPQVPPQPWLPSAPPSAPGGRGLS